MSAPASPPPETPASSPAAVPAAPPAPEITGRRAADRPVPPPAPRRNARKGVENVIGAFLLAVIVGGAIVWIENGRCPGALRGALGSAAPIAVPLAVVIATILANQDRSAPRGERIARGIRMAAWATAAALALVTGILLALNESGPRDVEQRRCQITRRETVPARTAGVGEWVLVLRCSDTMGPVRIDVDRRTWWEREAGGPVEATVARGRYGIEWVIDTEIGPPIAGFTSW